MLLGAVCVGLGAVVIGRFFRSSRPTREKLEPYECGNPAIGDTRGRFSVKFYSVAMLFLLFDAEALFLWPWAAQYHAEGLFFLFEALLFIVIVGIGYLYAWRKGAFEWR